MMKRRGEQKLVSSPLRVVKKKKEGESEVPESRGHLPNNIIPK